MKKMASIGMLGAVIAMVFVGGCRQNAQVESSSSSSREATAAVQELAASQSAEETPDSASDPATENAEGQPDPSSASDAFSDSQTLSEGLVSDGVVASESTEKKSIDPTTTQPDLPQSALESSGDTASTGNPSSATVAVDTSAPKVHSNGEKATEEERNQTIAADWPAPQLVLYVSGQQQGYIEPCGCTGLENQKGGLIRRDTLIASLRDRGWQVLPIDVGNQVRRAGQQQLIKFDTTAQALQKMGYGAIALGVNDLRLSKVDLIQIGGSEESSPRPYICANVVVLLPDFFPPYRIVEAGGRKVGITAVLGREFELEVQGDEVEFLDPVESLKRVIPELQSKGCDYIVLLAHASLDESASLAQAVEGIDLVVTAGGYGEPTLHPESIPNSKSLMVQVGVKGMYGGIIGLYDDPQQPIRYQKLAISSQFKDSERMLELFAEYQKRLEDSGFSGLGLVPATHPTGRKFVGSESCGECHTTAFDIWKDSPHIHATDSIVAANNDRGGIARHFDPECVSCHVTGWNPQEFSPFESGYVDLEQSAHLLASGCENCHGPGSAHVAAENGEIEASAELLKQLREEMILPLDRAEQKCLECHDLDNSPDFHDPGAFDVYWEQVKHYGKD